MKHNRELDHESMVSQNSFQRGKRFTSSVKSSCVYVTGNAIYLDLLISYYQVLLRDSVVREYLY